MSRSRRLGPIVGLGLQLLVQTEDAILDQAALQLAATEYQAVQARMVERPPTSTMAQLGRENVYATPVLSKDEIDRRAKVDLTKKAFEDRDTYREVDDGKDPMRELAEAGEEALRQKEQEDQALADARALAEKHEKEQAAFAKQAQAAQERFEEAHKDDPAEQQKIDLAKLEEAKQAAQELLAQRQEAERREAERLREEQQKAEIAVREAADREL